LFIFVLSSVLFTLLLQWQVSPVEGFDDQYTIEVPQPPPPHIPIPLPPVVGFTVDDVESGAIVQLSAQPKGWRIRHMPRDDLTIGESYAFVYLASYIMGKASHF